MDINPPVNRYDNYYLGTNIFFEAPPYTSLSAAIPFGKSINAYDENLTIRNSEIFSPRDNFLNFLQAKKPTSGDSVYLTLYIKNNGNAFYSYIDYILTDDNNYILNHTPSVASQYYSTPIICNGQEIEIGPSQEKSLNIKINTQNFMNNGNYKVYVMFYNLRPSNSYSSNNYPSNLQNCGEVDNQNTFYSIIPFTIYPESSKLGIIFFVVIIFTILNLFFSYIPKISRVASNEKTLTIWNKIKEIIKSLVKNRNFLILIIALIVLIALIAVI